MQLCLVLIIEDGLLAGNVVWVLREEEEEEGSRGYIVDVTSSTSAVTNA